ncbi:DNA-binding protein [Stenotrophomonas sp. ATs4]|uniref:DNA-binding protein n=1 Tax=Stenotrophomonas sp. ATs4 TaxID=3402766 RepID=UPI003F71DB03
MNARRRTTALRTAGQARQWLIDNGLSVTAFAERHGLDRNAVNNALRSTSKCRIGKTHDAAVALGMKSAPDSHTDLLFSTRVCTAKHTTGKAPVKKTAATKAKKAWGKA